MDRSAQCAVLEKELESKFDLNRAVELLKLYQFFPVLLKKNVVELILLQSLAQDGDFTVLSLLLNAEVRSDERIAAVFALHDALETSTYGRFWTLFKSSDCSKRVPGLLGKVQQSVLEVVALTYQRIERSLLVELLGLSSGAELAQLLAGKPGWSEEGDMVKVPLRPLAHSAAKAASSHDQKLAILQALKR